MSWLANLVPGPNPSSRLPLTFETFCTDFLPAALAYYVSAVLVILPRTLPLRLALLPVTIWLLHRAATSIDVGAACGDSGYEFLGYGLCITMIAAGMRVTEWAFIQKPLRRTSVRELDVAPFNGVANDDLNVIADGHNMPESPLLEQHPTLGDALWDALELVFNLRGHGWNWAQSWYFPPETRPTSSTFTFLALTLVSAIKNLLLFDLTLNTIRSFSPSAFGSSVGGSIYDPSLPPYRRYAQSTFITLVAGITICSALQLVYDVLTIICIPILQQYPTQWPPLFDSPWLSTSLADCWGRRWHQVFRGSFIGIGARPFSFLVGRVGGVMGAFFWSAILHDFGMWGVGRGTEFKSVGGFFLAMGAGCILEALYKKVTGLKVGGWTGWLWTMFWMMGWGHLFVDAYARRGLIGSKFIPEAFMPSQILLSYIYRYTA